MTTESISLLIAGWASISFPYKSLQLQPRHPLNAPRTNIPGVELKPYYLNSQSSDILPDCSFCVFYYLTAAFNFEDWPSLRNSNSEQHLQILYLTSRSCGWRLYTFAAHYSPWFQAATQAMLLSFVSQIPHPGYMRYQWFLSRRGKQIYRLLTLTRTLLVRPGGPVLLVRSTQTTALIAMENFTQADLYHWTKHGYYWRRNGLRASENSGPALPTKIKICDK